MLHTRTEHISMYLLEGGVIMDRLTERFSDGKAFITPSIASLTTGMYQVIQRLADYEDAEEKGWLLRLPCKVGDIIYEPTNRDTINEYRVTGIKKGMFSLWIEWELEEGFIYQSIYGVEVGDIGKTVFLTKEEAEKALAELKQKYGK